MHCNYLRRTSKWILLPLTIEMECGHFKPKAKSIHGGRHLDSERFFFFLLSYRIIYWHKVHRGNGLLNIHFNHAVCTAVFRCVKANNSRLLCEKVCFANPKRSQFVKTLRNQSCVSSVVLWEGVRFALT